MTTFQKKTKEWNIRGLEQENPYDQVMRPWSRNLWTLLSEDLLGKLNPIGTDNSLLDIGCGNGHLLSLLAQSFDKVSGTDYADSMIEHAKINLSNGDFTVAEASSLPFDKNSFSHVLCYSIFHYFPNINYAKKAIREMIRVTRSRGVIIIGDVLDVDFQSEIVNKSDKEIESKIPLIHRYSEWMFFDLSLLSEICLDCGAKEVTIMEQPYGFKLRKYRRDIRIVLDVK